LYKIILFVRTNINIKTLNATMMHLKLKKYLQDVD